jgi:hypothetical protein
LTQPREPTITTKIRRGADSSTFSLYASRSLTGPDRHA